MLEDTDLYYGDSFAAEYVRFECDGGIRINLEIVGISSVMGCLP